MVNNLETSTGGHDEDEEFDEIFNSPEGTEYLRLLKESGLDAGTSEKLTESEIEKELISSGNFSETEIKAYMSDSSDPLFFDKREKIANFLDSFGLFFFGIRALNKFISDQKK